MEWRINTVGPFYAKHLRSGDSYELSRGHPIRCLPTSGRRSSAILIGAAVLESDPDVESAGVDTGFSLDDKTLRAPDIAVGNVPNKPGWAPGVPPLAVEYVDTGEDEAGLQEKIAELLNAGTQYIWVVRLTGPRRVEVYQAGKTMEKMLPGKQLTAPGILRNPVDVNALFDPKAAHQATLRNLLQREGFDNGIEGVFAEGKAEAKAKVKAKAKVEGKAEILIHLAQLKFGGLSQAHIKHINQLNGEALMACTERLLTAESVEQVLGRS